MAVVTCSICPATASTRQGTLRPSAKESESRLYLWNGDDNVLYLGSVLWGRYSNICLKFGVGQIISVLIFPFGYCPAIFLSIFFLNWTADYLGSLRKLVLLFAGLRKLLDISTPVPNVQSRHPHWVDIKPHDGS